MNTTGNSRPLAECNVINVTALCSASYSSMSVTSDSASRNAWMRGIPTGTTSGGGSSPSPASRPSPPSPAAPAPGAPMPSSSPRAAATELAAAPTTSPRSSASSNSRATPTSSRRFSIRPAASIDRSASSSAR